MSWAGRICSRRCSWLRLSWQTGHSGAQRESTEPRPHSWQHIVLGAGISRSLLDVIDETETGMGARLLRSWLLRPSIRRGEIEARHGAVAELHAAHMKRDGLRNLLKEVADVERLTGRLNLS